MSVLSSGTFYHDEDDDNSDDWLLFLPFEVWLYVCGNILGQTMNDNHISWKFSVYNSIFSCWIKSERIFMIIADYDPALKAQIWNWSSNFFLFLALVSPGLWPQLKLKSQFLLKISTDWIYVV